MKIISVNNNTVILELNYDDIDMVIGTLQVPNHAFDAPNFELNIQESQSDVDKLSNSLREFLESKEDYGSFHKSRLDLMDTNRKEDYKTNLILNKKDFMLLTKAFKEASKFTRENDNFHTMTGYKWDDAIRLQGELDLISKQI